MEYISAEEFLKQPKEVQRIFLEYFDHEKMLFLDGVIYFETFKDEGKHIPLLTEGQLRKFIEDKTGYIDITLNDIADNTGNKNYEIECYPYILYEGFGDSKEFNVWATDLLQAYWKVACEIASNGGEF